MSHGILRVAYSFCVQFSNLATKSTQNSDAKTQMFVQTTRLIEELRSLACIFLQLQVLALLPLDPHGKNMCKVFSPKSDDHFST